MIKYLTTVFYEHNSFNGFYFSMKRLSGFNYNILLC